MKLQLLFTLVIGGLNIYCSNGFPTESSKSVPNFSIGGKLETLPDPDESVEIPKISQGQAEEILEDLGYATPDGFEIGTRSDFGGSERIRTFQRDYGLPETCILDDETRLAIGSPRCGTRSADKSPSGMVRRWSKSVLSYTIANFPEGQPVATIRALIKRAFGEWSRVTNLDFKEVGDSDSADIEIAFGGQDHTMRYVECSFQSSQTMAHAFFPKLGDLHFNTKYFFEDGDKTLRDFLDTALHEIGHSLGLDHINSKASLMHPSASNQFTKPQPIDVEYIQALYGVRSGSTFNSPSTFCSLPKIDAIFEDAFGTLYAFAGDYFYDLSGGNPEGQLISSKWPGLPGNIDAAFQFGNGRSYFFKGDKYYRFKGSRMESVGLRTIRKGFPGLPSNVDAVMVDDEGDLFVFKGSQYWIYFTELKRTSGPRDIENLGLVPKNVDAVVMRSDKKLMSFKGKSYYTWSSQGLSKKMKICDSLDA